MFAFAQKPLTPSSVSSTSSNTNDICGETSSYPKIIAGETTGVKPSQYCKIDPDAGKVFFCKSSGNKNTHECTYTGPYKKPSMMSSFSSMFSRSRGGKYKRRRTHMKKNKTKKINRKNKTRRLENNFIHIIHKII